MPPRALVALFAVALAVAPATSARDLVEYHHAGLDHWFLTGEANEIRDLDAGVHAGWQRTGRTIAVFDAGDARLAGSVPVCRFYGRPEAGLDSHFYAATPQECEAVQQRFAGAWVLETPEAFRVHPVSAPSGACPAGTRPVYRLYNNRPDANHRYTTDPDVYAAMVAQGYVPEGVGAPLPVAFCAAGLRPTRGSRAACRRAPSRRRSARRSCCRRRAPAPSRATSGSPARR